MKPTLRQLDELMGFEVPESYFHLIELAFEVNPDDPWNAFRAIGLLNLDAAGREAVSYTKSAGQSMA